MSENTKRKRFLQDLKGWPPPPVGDDFYQAVWKRIRQREEAGAGSADVEFWDWLGNLCWKALPACLLLVLVAGGWVLFLAPDASPPTSWEEEVMVSEPGSPREEMFLLESIFFEPEERVNL